MKGTRIVGRAAAIGALAFSLGAVTVAVVVSATQADRIAPGRIVIVGEQATPGMQEVLHELHDRVANGDDLRATLQLDASALVIPLLVLLWIGVGAVIVWRQPGNWAGWLFLITGLAAPFQLIASAVVIPNLKGDGSFPLTGLFAWLGEFALYPIALLPLLFLLYPDGHPPSRRWRWAVVGLLGGLSLVFLGFLLRPGPYNNWRDDGIVYANPLGINDFTWAGTLIGLGAVVALAAALSTAVAVVVRFRRSTGEERQQMRVLAFVASLAGAGMATTIALGVVGGALGFDDNGSSPIFNILWIASMLTVFFGIPIAYLVAIFRYRLWDLDVVIKKTVVALVLTLLMAGVGVAVLLIAGRFAVSGDANPRIAVLVGIVFGLLFVPLLRLARRIAGRLTFGRRATPYEVLTAFGERVGETYSTEDVLPRMAQLLANGTGASSARVLLRVGPELREEARWPADAPDPDDEHVVPVVDRGEELGALAVSMPASDPMNPAKDKLVSDLAAQAGLLLRNVKLIEELRASRQRLVAAQDEERRRLERNLHDGAQQQLVALSVQLKLARTMIDRDPGKAGTMLDTVQGAATDALEDLRDLARGIYPPLLADKGLPDAIAAQVRRAAIPVEIETDGVGRYRQDVEAAVYFCTLEALNNVAKYAEATRASVRLVQSDGHLTFTVTDDGRGFDAGSTTYGTGLQGMADRLEAIGGSLAVTSGPSVGTRIVGTVPASDGVES
ncbi:MAG: sensor histidine kinase [Actinomycetota bacterium]